MLIHSTRVLEILFFRLLVCVFAFLHVCLFDWVLFQLIMFMLLLQSLLVSGCFNWLFVCLFVFRLCIYVFVYLSVSLFVCLFTCLCFCYCVCLGVWVSHIFMKCEKLKSCNSFYVYFHPTGCVSRRIICKYICVKTSKVTVVRNKGTFHLIFLHSKKCLVVFWLETLVKIFGLESGQFD